MKDTKKFTNNLPCLLAFAMVNATASGLSLAQDTARVLASAETAAEADSARLEKMLATLTKFVKAEQFSSLKEVEDLLDGEFKIELQHPSAIHYKLVSKDSIWRATALANIGTASPSGKYWLRTIEVVTESICIPEGELSEIWFREAGIPKEKSIYSRSPGTWTTRSIPHVINTMSWSFRPSNNRTIVYWLDSLDPKACANGFSFSFSPKSKD